MLVTHAPTGIQSGRAWGCVSCGGRVHHATDAEVAEEMGRRLARLVGRDVTPAQARALLAGNDQDLADRLRAAREVEELLALARPDQPAIQVAAR